MVTKFRPSLHLALVAAGALLTLAPAERADAKPMHLKSLGEHYGTFLAGRLNQCGTCHLPSTTGKAPESLADLPHNPFGKRLAAVLEELRQAGKATDFSTRLRAVGGQDSDGDGVPNRTEILTGHRPGDPTDRPSPKELAGYGKTMTRFAAYASTYRWRPFQPVRRPAVPKVKNASWVRSPIDAFVAAEHERRGLKPRPPAPKAVLLRRVYLDLIGLSPTPEEQRAFLADSSPSAYEKVVDRLLASPAYGERWGRHWMDVWRYSDWTGYGEQVRDSLPHIWRWRDWIVESLNRDKGYDRMVVEMLAADEAYPTDADALRGTGYLVRNYKLLSREKWMQDVVDHTGQAFLGLTVGCARCHDHMYDPLSQKEYYQLRAIFEPHQVRTDWVPGETDTKKDGLPRAYDAKLDAPTYLYVRGDERQPLKDTPLQPGVPEALGDRLQVEPVELPLWAHVPEKQPHVIRDLRAASTERVLAALKEVEDGGPPEKVAMARLRLEAAEAAQAALDAVLRVESLEDAGQRVSEEWQQAAQDAVVQQRRQAHAEAALNKAVATEALAKLEKANPPAKPDALKKAKDALAVAEKALVAAEKQLKDPGTTAFKPRVTSNFPATSTGRRLAFARWLVNPQNPLTARAAVNHIWLRHFGKGLAPNPADLGRASLPPTHPELLDYLASLFSTPATIPPSQGGRGQRAGEREQFAISNLQLSIVNTSGHFPTGGLGWSMKRLHRLIVTSNTYRMASTPETANLAKDPDNRYLWRMNSLRMDAEIVRDNVLHVAGQLDRMMGGPEIDQHQGLSVKRRSLYFRHAPEKEMVFLSTFDGPNPLECYMRKETIVPQQALALANSELALVQSRLLARDLTKQIGADQQRFIHTAFERILSRLPSPAERSECLQYLTARRSGAGKTVTTAATAPADGSKPSADPAQRAREMLVLVLLNHNDFITIR